MFYFVIKFRVATLLEKSGNWPTKSERNQGISIFYPKSGKSQGIR